MNPSVAIGVATLVSRLSLYLKREEFKYFWGKVGCLKSSIFRVLINLSKASVGKKNLRYPTIFRIIASSNWRRLSPSISSSRVVQSFSKFS